MFDLKPLLTSLVANGVSQKYLAGKLDCDPKTVRNIICRDAFIKEDEVRKRLGGLSPKTFRGLITDGVVPIGNVHDGERVWQESVIDGVMR